MQQDSNKHPFALIPEFDGDPAELFSIEIPDTVPVLPLRNMIAFPLMMMPVSVGRKSSLQLITEAYEQKLTIGLFTQRNGKDDEIPDKAEALFTQGVAARVAKILDFPDGSHTAILHCMVRITLVDLNTEGQYLTASIKRQTETLNTDMEFGLICRAIRVKAAKLLESHKDMPDETLFSLKNMENDLFLVNFLSATLPFNVDLKYKMLKVPGIKERAEELLRNINNMQALLDLKAEIEEKTQSELNHQQKEYFLHQEMKVIQEELGEAGTFKDIDELRRKADELPLPENVRPTFDAELSKLKRINPQNADYGVQLNYLQTIVSLPWDGGTKDNLNLTNAERTLNHDHYGMQKVKERILEHLAVLKLRGDMKSPILCLYGPPGVGKTSLGKSIASALRRKYVRASLGGIHDESEIRGHRRTYIGAMPGRIIKGIAKAGSCNPVFILDEIDKISGQTINGDPSSALLEVLDPEQNIAFHDNFLEIDYDLSKVMFIATANDLSAIPRPLLDRMELIEVSGYCTEDKMEIARKHLIPRAMENNGLGSRTDLKIKKQALEFLIEHYTRESGVRALEKQLNKLFRKLALLSLTKGEDAPAPENIDPVRIVELLGKEPFNRDIYQGNELPGVVTGLAWTSVGGEILFIESSLSQGTGSKLTLTGNLGDVMKESAMLAIEFIKSHNEEFGIDHRLFDQWNIHVHVPEGATPKDGPSAGIAMVTSIVSSITQRKVRARLAMTGEITLRGKVLPVGGIKEKILAAKRAGITDIVLCQDNKKDIGEIPDLYLQGLTFHYVDTILEVIDIALLQEKVRGAKEFKIKEQDSGGAGRSPEDNRRS